MVLYSSTKFGILKPWTNIQSLGRFDLGLWQTSKQIYRKLQYKQKVYVEFQGFSHFPRKMVLYSWTKFCMLKPWTNIQSLRKFHLGFWQASKQIYRKLQYREKVFGEFKTLPRFLKRMVLFSSIKFVIIKSWTNIPWSAKKFIGNSV